MRRVVAALVLLCADVRADPMPSAHLSMRDTGELRAASGTYDLPAGTHVLAPDAWTALDVEMRRLQERETRLEAENASFRASAAAWRPGWVTIAAAVVVGLSSGIYLGVKL